MSNVPDTSPRSVRLWLHGGQKEHSKADAAGIYAIRVSKHGSAAELAAAVVSRTVSHVRGSGVLAAHATDLAGLFPLSAVDGFDGLRSSFGFHSEVALCV